MRSLVVLSAGVSTPSTTLQLADALAQATVSQLTARGEGAEVIVVELRELAAELATAATSWTVATPGLDSARDVVGAADGLIAATPVFQGSYSGLFKLFFDTLPPAALEGTPAIIAATGGSSRHAHVLDYALRPLLNYLHALTVPTGVFQATQDFGSSEGGRTQRRILRAAQQLADLMVGPADRVSGLTPLADTPVTDPAGSFQPFSVLLRGHTGQQPED
ncbi:NAD(P)H-dependent oxidoreductase [Corynebacterium lizhenjunii]|uniref:NAD(P)H-dependent oxidoreductase n=1 Tax=Corynebacterium lizhenjunii TaxID=2709394 RepID=A0A7T0PB66_9CORY|nr:CE1759 family FMN reductase [Corynebacterium lizhenjunii]QPK78227.1 NAD(P)H-dependent oxidoreductase [Corynebacterium lizhenjunii]